MHTVSVKFVFSVSMSELGLTYYICHGTLYCFKHHCSPRNLNIILLLICTVARL